MEGVGVELAATSLPGWSDPASLVRSHGTYCRADELGVVVFDSVTAS